jgi:hypothetical protein
MNRRIFIHAAGATTLALGAGRALTHSDRVPSDGDRSVMELLELLTESPRESLPRILVGKIRAGLSSEALLAALSIAAVRSVQPYPDVGFKYHSIMVLRSIHLAMQHLPAADRWLPVIWAVDYFKSTQAEERATSGWHMPERAARSGVTAQQAHDRLVAALDRWDRDAADAAIVDYASVAPKDEIFALLFTYGTRDLRAIGHKAISVCNAHSLFAVLGNALGEAHAQSILRSTVAALQNSDDEPNPATHDLEPDRPFRRNLALLAQIPQDWKNGRNALGARAELRAALYRVAPQEAGAITVEMLRRGISPDALWQTLFDTAAELITIQPGIVALHAQTSANALHYAYQHASDEHTQQLALLQCAAFVAMFRAMTGARQERYDLAAEEPLPLGDAKSHAVEEIFSDVSAGNRRQATRKAFGYLQSGGDAEALMAAIRHHVVYQANEPHDYKFPEAVLDTYSSLADHAWRCRFLSAGLALFKSPASRPTRIVAETLELLRA